MKKMYRIGYTHHHPWDSTLDGQGEVMIRAECRDEAIDLFREDHGEASHKIDYVGAAVEEE